MDEVPIHLHIELLPEGVYLATSPDVPDLIVEADTVAQAVETAKGCTLALLESYLAHGDPVPPALEPLRHKRGANQSGQTLDLIIPVGNA